MRIDFYASEVQFVDHLVPVWKAVEPSDRGDFIVARSLSERVTLRGAVPWSSGRDPDLSRPVVVASYGDVSRMRRMGRTRIACAEHGAGQSYGGDRTTATNSSYAGGKGRDDVGLFLVPNEYAAGRMREAYPGRVEIVGCPKVDTLPAREPGPGPVVALSFHFPIHLIPEMGSAVGHYLPIFTPSPAGGPSALAKHFRLIGHGHPKQAGLDWPRYMAKVYRRRQIEYVPDFDDVCRRADIYVCDNSSTIFEFASTGRPVVLLNAPQFRRNVHHGGRFWDWATVGLQCDRPADLIPTIELALADTEAQRAERERIVALIYPYRGEAAQRAATALVEWASGRAEEAA